MLKHMYHIMVRSYWGHDILKHLAPHYDKEIRYTSRAYSLPISLKIFQVHVEAFVPDHNRSYWGHYINIWHLFQRLISHFLVHFFCQKYTSKYNFTRIAHNSLNNGFWAVLIPFLEVRYFWCFWIENHVFDVGKKSSSEQCVFVQYFFTSIYHYNIGLNFPKFRT